MSNNSQLSFQEFHALYQKIQSLKANVKLQANELNFNFHTKEDKDIVEKEFKKVGFTTSSYSQKSFALNNIAQNLIFYDNLNSLFDKLKLDTSVLNTSNIIVFDENGSYLYYDHVSKEIESNLSLPNYKSLFSHFLQYTSLLALFLEEKGRLIEIEKDTLKGQELIILSKGEDKLITSINYLGIDRDVFNYPFSDYQLDKFEIKLKIDEWLACFKNTLCQFMELQLEEKRTFGNLYNNFSYVFNQTEKNYQLYVSKFSFDKIRKQFKAEKNNYFEGLNLAQDKISSQIISIPISLGASIYSFFQLEANYQTLVLIFISVCLYSLFITYVLIMSIYDVKKIGKDSDEERKNLIKYYPDLFIHYKSDFKFMKNKQRRVLFLAWAIIIALIVTLISISIFVFNYGDAEKNIFRFVFNN